MNNELIGTGLCGICIGMIIMLSSEGTSIFFSLGIAILLGVIGVILVLKSEGNEKMEFKKITEIMNIAGSYEEFADEFYELCEKYALKSFNGNLKGFNGKQVLRICKKIINDFAI